MAKEPHVADGYNIGLHQYRTFPSQKVLLDGAILDYLLRKLFKEQLSRYLTISYT